MKSEKEMFVQVSEMIKEKWYDPVSKTWFNPADGVVSIPSGTEISNINRYLTLNYLEDKTPKPVKEIKGPPDAKTHTPGQLLARDLHPPKIEDVAKKEPEKEVEITIDILDDEEINLDIEDLEDIGDLDTPDEDSEMPQDNDDEEDKDKKDSNKVACQYCGKEYSPRGVKTHEKACADNPQK